MGGPVVQLLACVRVDMRHHQVHLILCKVLEGCPFRKDPADELMRYFDTAFLAGSLRITVENISPAAAVFIKLNRGRVREFAASVAVILSSA